MIEQGLTAAGLKLGTAFLIENCRVGSMNDVNTILITARSRPTYGRAVRLNANR